MTDDNLCGVAKQTENETANHVIDINIERTDKVLIQARLIFDKKTSLSRIIENTKTFIEELKKGINNGDGYA